MTRYTAKPAHGAVWITGGSTGIGAAVARRYAGEGFTVYCSARSEDQLNALAAEPIDGNGKIVALPLDVTNREACAAAVEKIVSEAGGLAVTMLNAGAFFPVKGTELTHENFDKTYAVNFFGVTNCLIPALEAKKAAGRGQVSIVASVSGYGGLKLAASYGSSKAALINLCESLKFDLDAANIRIQLINPGFIDTPMTEQNEFPMPFLMSVEDAADRVHNGMKTGGFELTFPRRFTYMLKFLNLLPYTLYFPLVGRATAGKKDN